MSTFVRSWIARLARSAAFGVLFAAAAAQAAPMPNAMRKVSITAREQPIAAFLQNLLAGVDVPVALSPQLTGTVNGTFAGPAEKVLNDVARVYNLVSYYDGAVMHVVPASQMASRTYPVSRQMTERTLREAFDLGLTDSRNTLRNTGNGNLVAVGTPRFIEQVDDLVRAGQAAQSAAAAPPSPGMLDFKVYYLRYAWAQDTTMNLGGRQVVLPGVASILRSLVSAPRSTAGAQDLMVRPTQPKLKGQGLASQGVAANSKEPGGDSQRGRSGVDALVAALNTAAQPAEVAAAPMAYDPRQVTIEAEPRLNAVIVRDVAERLPRYDQLIAALDVEPQSLEIEATIIDVNVDRLRELGVNWRWNNAGREVGYNGGVPTAGVGGIASAVLGSVGQFVARIRALQAEGAARIVSSPQVVTLSDVEAVFDNSSTFYVRVAGREQVDLFNVSAGTSLRVTPHVFRDRDDTRIKLLVQVEDGNLTGHQVDQIPVVERSTINTQALITEGESLLIGGMVRESTSSSVDKVPGLGDVPIIGNAFKNRTSSSSRVERMFLITPRLAGARPAPVGAGLRTAATAAPTSASTSAPAATSQTKPATVPVAPIAAIATPAPAPAAVTPAAPAIQTLVQRASVVLDLDAPLPAAATRSISILPAAQTSPRKP